MQSIIGERIKQSIAVKQAVLDKLVPQIEQLTTKVIESYKKGGKLILFGNGGSASDAQHIVAELVNKQYFDRPMLDAIALNVNTSVITAIGNDSSYDYVFSRQIESLVKPNDVLIAITTSGNSINIINAVKKACEKGIYTVLWTGLTGGKLVAEHKDKLNLIINVPSQDTARIQESHIMVGHIMCELIEKELFKEYIGSDYKVT
ncbi:SIS domain-containing protein [Candidatus Woesearchaeota archaeon]|nr:SIS domain-containing protein [Candidatus Woesearchaeota archaeon]